MHGSDSEARTRQVLRALFPGQCAAQLRRLQPPAEAISRKRMMFAGQIAGHSAGHLESSDYAAVRADVAAGILRTREDVYPRVPAEGYRHSDNIQVRVVFAAYRPIWLNYGPLTMELDLEFVAS